MAGAVASPLPLCRSDRIVAGLFCRLDYRFLVRLLGAIVFAKIGDQFQRKTVFVVADVGRHPRHRAESVLG